MRIALAGDSSKHSWMLALFPVWTAKRPWRLLSFGASGTALRMWLLSECTLAVETGRFRRIPRAERWCKVCPAMVGDERHTLSQGCGRCTEFKAECREALRSLRLDRHLKTVADDIPDLCLQIRFLTGDGWLLAWRWLLRLLTKIKTSLQLELATDPIAAVVFSFDLPPPALDGVLLADAE